MAATWTYKVEVTDAANKVFTVTGTRTDGTDIRTYSLSGLSYVVTATQTLASIRATIVAVIFNMYLAQKDLTTATAAIASQEALLATATNAKETA